MYSNSHFGFGVPICSTWWMLIWIFVPFISANGPFSATIDRYDWIKIGICIWLYYSEGIAYCPTTGGPFSHLYQSFVKIFSQNWPKIKSNSPNCAPDFNSYRSARLQDAKPAYIGEVGEVICVIAQGSGDRSSSLSKWMQHRNVHIGTFPAPAGKEGIMILSHQPLQLRWFWALGEWVSDVKISITLVIIILRYISSLVPRC